MKNFVKYIMVTLLVLAGVSMAGESHALIGFNFTSGGVLSGNNYGNDITFTSGASTLVANSWADTGDNDTFETARIRRWSTGLGSCNQNEGLNCPDPEHQVDNYLDHDWVLFVLDDVYTFESITLDPFGTWDRDISYWIGTVDPLLINLAGLNYSDLAGLGFGSQQDVFNTPSGLAFTVDLNSQLGNALLVGAYKDQTSTDSQEVDRFKVSALSADTPVVPEPASMFLFGSGLLASAFVRRKRS